MRGEDGVLSSGLSERDDDGESGDYGCFVEESILVDGVGGTGWAGGSPPFLNILRVFEVHFIQFGEC